MPDTGTVIADTAGNPAVGFTDFEVTNNSTADGTPPVPASAEVGASGDRLTLTFNEDLDLAAAPYRSAFTVKADGVEVPGTSVFTRPEDSDQLALQLSAPIGARQIVTVSYAVPTIGRVIEDLAGNEAVAFEDFPVTNNSTVANTTPPVPASAEVPASGASLTLTFNEDLDNGPDKLPPATAFSVTADGVDVPVQSVTAGSGADQFRSRSGRRRDQPVPDGHGGLRGAHDQSHPGHGRQAGRGLHRLRGHQQLHGRVSQPQRSGVRGRRSSDVFRRGKRAAGHGHRRTGDRDGRGPRHPHIQRGHRFALRELFPDRFGDGPTADQRRQRARL